jgi:hypothetical protein
VRRFLLTAAGVLAASALGGCGAAYPDLFILSRTGTLPGAHLTLLVGDGGTVRCNGGPEQRLPDQLLLDARHIATSLTEDAQADLVLPRRSDALLRYRLRYKEGTVTFSDVDAGRRPELGPVVAFARTVAKDVCGLSR